LGGEIGTDKASRAMIIREYHFCDAFKAMWEENSKVLLLWDALEDLCLGLNDRSQQLAGRQASFRTPHERSQAFDSKSEPMEKLYIEVSNQLWNKLLLRTHLKVRDSMHIMFQSANTANAYGCALAVRSVLEHVALLQYFWDKVPWRTSRVVTADKLAAFSKELVTLVLGSNLDWSKLTGGLLREMLASGQWKRPGKERLPPITTLIVALDDALMEAERIQAKGQMLFIYGILCDVVHPSWGGDFVYSTKMEFSVDSEPQFNDSFRVASIMFCLPVVELVRHFYHLTDELQGQTLRVVTMSPNPRHQADG
jgi:hypothetical protein